ncbi:hypothetical protein LCGC14_0295610 [marine sediment metagenome]|uniref:Uncharacterized protein n=1 Tax=marine sediment metagenome TaxID=412755 RepID=A0A0F9WD08_9ZZZZ|nr:hypothetical protein [Phycisphaerae bacterium]HDZ43029.1 hypothetical protein [Phycisphaerae bacterium]
MDIKNVKVGERCRWCDRATGEEQIVTVVEFTGLSFSEVSATRAGNNALPPETRPGDAHVTVKPDGGENFFVRVADLEPSANDGSTTQSANELTN